MAQLENLEKTPIKSIVLSNFGRNGDRRGVRGDGIWFRRGKIENFRDDFSTQTMERFDSSIVFLLTQEKKKRKYGTTR